MSTPLFQPDDPRLTAYALNELSATERDEFEAILKTSPEAQAALDEIKETISLLHDELSLEPIPQLTEEQRAILDAQVAAVQDAAVTATTVVKVGTETARGSSRRGALIGLTATAAAIVAVAVTLPQRSGLGLASRTEPAALSNSADSPFSAEDFSQSDPASLRKMSGESPHSVAFADRESFGRKADIADVKDGLYLNDEVQNLPLVRGLESAGSTASGPLDSKVKGIVAEVDKSGPASGPGLGKPASAVDALSEEARGSGVARGGAFKSDSAMQNANGSDRRRLAEMKPQNSASSLASRPAAGPAPLAGEPVSGSSAKPAAAAPQSKAGEPVSTKFWFDESRTKSLSKEEATQRLAVIPQEKASEQNRARFALPGQPASPPVPVGAAAEGLTTLLSEKAPELRPSAVEAEGEAKQLAQGAPRTELERLVVAAGRESRASEVPDHDHEVLNRYRVLMRGREVQDVQAGNEAYDPIVENEFVSPIDQPLSTFSIDVDTASYANVRRFIQQGQMPPRNAVRIEELVNYFKYDYPEPKDGEQFSVTVDVAACPWQPKHRLARVGLKAKSFLEQKRPPTNLVFLLDVSGSMRPANKLPLVQQAMNVLVSQMSEDDQVAIVTYAGDAGLKLDSTPGSKRADIQRVIDGLSAGGSTNGAAGIEVAYDTAIKHFIKGGANRVILCTDGDFNVGVSDDNRLVEIIQEKAASGVFLSVFGFGMGNLKDGKLEKLADKGNGQYGYIDGLKEARKVFQEQLAGTLFTVAKDVKLQLDFEKANVGAYRLIGYENRVLAARDFDDDTKDAGEIGAGHTVTALYEIMPKIVWLERMGIDSSKFELVEKKAAQTTEVEAKPASKNLLFTVKLRHKLPEEERSTRSLDFPINDHPNRLNETRPEFQWAASVAGFGMQLRDSRFRGQWTLADVLVSAESAKRAIGHDENGDQTEFLDLVRGAMRIQGQVVPSDDAPAAPPTSVKELPATEARLKASVNGKYRRLLKKIEVRNDVNQYGEFRDWGHYDGTSYAGFSDLPAGYWVWVYPNWYIWGDQVEAGATPSPASNPAEEPATKLEPGATPKTDAPAAPAKPSL